MALDVSMIAFLLILKVGVFLKLWVDFNVGMQVCNLFLVSQSIYKMAVPS